MGRMTSSILPHHASGSSKDACLQCCARQVEMSQSYSRTDWQEDLKRMLRRAGAEGARCLFLFSDTEVMAAGHLCNPTPNTTGGGVSLTSKACNYACNSASCQPQACFK